MVDYNSWLSSGAHYIDAETRAASAWNRIQDKPTSIVIRRAKVSALAAQTVRIEVAPSASEAAFENAQMGATGQQSVTVFGVIGHPTVADTDIKRDDRFTYANKEYTIVGIATYPGEIQGFGQVTA